MRPEASSTDIPPDRNQGRRQVPEQVAETELGIRLSRDEGPIDGLYDPRSMWVRRRQMAPDGAVLVRPDRFVAWRSRSASEAPLEELSGALNQILARPIAVQPAAA